MESARTWDETCCEFDSWQRQIYIVFHVHWAYDYSGPFRVLRVHMARHKNCVFKKSNTTRTCAQVCKHLLFWCDRESLSQTLHWSIIHESIIHSHHTRDLIYQSSRSIVPTPLQLPDLYSYTCDNPQVPSATPSNYSRESIILFTILSTDLDSSVTT